MKQSNFWQQQEKNIVLHENGKMNVIETIERNNGLALVFVDEKGKREELTYEELREQVNQYCNYLVSQGVKKNQRVFVFLPKVKEFYIAFLATIKMGAIVLPLFEAFQTDGLELRLNRGDANVLISNSELLKRLKHKKRIKIINIDKKEFKEKAKKQKKEFECVLKNKNDTCIMMFTSSTAGTPVAGIQISHYALVQQYYTGKLVLNLDKQTRYWCTAHPGWVTGSVYGILAPLAIGATVYVLESHFDAKVWLDFMKENKISSIYTAPTALRLFRNDVKREDFKFVKTICSVGEALTSSVFDFYKKLGVTIRDTYWQTETGAMMIANLNGKRGTMGQAIKGINAKIKYGMICFDKPWPAMMTGIYKHNKMYKGYFSGKIFKTNDLASQDKKGYFHFIGRHDDIIKTSGERVSPLEIENILMKHKAVKEVGVIGKGDEMKGQIIKAFIVLNSQFVSSDEKKQEQLKEELGFFVKQNYAGHAYPKEIEFIKELPKTNSGKIIRMKLRELEEAKEKK
jgi:acetyl-CoA synthetase